MKNNYFFLFFLLLSALLNAQTLQLENHWWTPNGDVYSIVKDGNTVYLGGSFTSFGPNVTYGASVNTTTGQPDLTFANPNGAVLATVPDGAGGWYIGGHFTAIAGQTRNRIARINSDGSLHPWNPNANSAVYTLAVSGTTVYAGGYFTTIGGQARNNIAAIDATTGLVTAWNPNASNIVFTLVVNGTTVYVGGDFTAIGGQTRNRIAALDITTGLSTSWNPDANNYVNVLTLDGTTLYVGGAFTTIGGQTRNRIAALDTTTGLSTSWNPDSNNIINTIVVDGATVYAGGDFTNIGGQTRNYIAALNATTGLATAWDAYSNGTVRAAVLNGTSLYVGGNFTSVGGQARNRIAALDTTTGLPTAWDPNVNSPVYALALNGTNIYAGGNFYTMGAGLVRNRIAALDATTGQPTAWNPNANNIVQSVFVDGTTVYAGGDFTNIAGQSRNRIASIDATTGMATAWNPSASANVKTVTVNGNTVYAGGDFTTIGGQARNYIAALDASTGLATSWNPGANNTVNTIDASSATIYAGGYFSAIGGQTRTNIAALDAATGLATSWSPNANNIVNTITISGNTLYTGGFFTTIAGQTRNYIAALDITTGVATSWNPNANGAVRAIAINGGTVYAGGDFSNLNGQARGRLAALDATTGVATSWNPNANGIIRAMIINGNKVYAGGGFSIIGNSVKNGFAVYNSCTLAATAGAQTNVLCHGAATGEATVTATAGTGAYTYSWNTTPAQTTATATNLAAGTYTATVTDANGCIATQSFTITEPATALTASAGAQTNVLCNGGATGAATVNATGGTGAYTYSWELQGTPLPYCNSNFTNVTWEFITNVIFAGINNTSGANTGAPVNYTAQVAHVTAGNTYPLSVTIDPDSNDYLYAFIDWNQNGILNDAGEVYTLATNTSASGPFTINVNVPANAVSGATRMRVMTSWNDSSPNPCRSGTFGEAEDYTINVAASFNTGTNSISGVAAGTYIATVTDANGCTATQSFTITEPAVLTASAGAQTNVLCNGNATGEATVTATGGTGTYSYSWNTNPVQTTATATNLTAGTYIATVTDANNCTSTQSFTITEPTVLTASAGTQVNVLCNGNTTGEATVTATGGTGVYTYSWNTTPVQTTATATNLAAGTYIATVTDANNCTATQSFTITEPATALTASAGAQTNILCNGNATGEAIVNATGGTGAYSYSWNTTPVQTTATATNLAAGTYIATVTDANNCTATQSFTITEPATAMALTPNTTQTDVLCNGQATGSATVAVTGGTGAYTYLWSNGETANTITGLIAGTYTVDVTDANGCILSNSFTITQPTALVATAGPQTNVLCNGNTTGEATVNATGGTGAYTYSWNTTPAQTTATASGLAAGTYTVTVYDANQCQTTQSFTITQPAQPLSMTPNTSQTNVSCFGGANGTASIAVTGGTSPYTYLWSNGQTNAIATGLVAGTYTVTATDANGCTIANSYTITEPTALIATAGPQMNITCFGAANGAATVNATGGTGAYSYSWNTTPVQTTATATNLAPGNYTATVTDANNCAATQSFTITQPQQLTAAINNSANILCYGAATGSASVSAAGGTNSYTYLWNNGQTTATATALTAGNYSVIVTDANGCQANANVTITQPATPLVATAGAQTNLICNGNTNGSATVNVTGGTGTYTYSWNTNPVQTTATATGLSAGTYTVTVYDANQCQTTHSFTITQPAAVAGYFTVVNSDCHVTGSATIHATGGTAPYTYLWSNGNTTPNLLNALPGTYTVTVTDINGCSNVLSTTINGTVPIVVTSQPQSVTIDGGETVIFTVEAQNVVYYQWQVSTNGGQTFSNLNGGGSMPGYNGVATPTLTITNAYQVLNGYQYRVILMQQNGCYILSDAATLTVNAPIVGIDDIKHLEMSIYPNPASTEVFVKIPNLELLQNARLELFDLNGRLVKSDNRIKSDEYRLDVTGLESGIYIIRITADDYKTDKKLIVNKKF